MVKGRKRRGQKKCASPYKVGDEDHPGQIGLSSENANKETAERCDQDGCK